MNTLPSISQQDIKAASEQPDELIYLLIKRYNDVIVASGSREIMAHFTMEQNILWAFNALDGQVCNGGFIQLIENKYGGYIFYTPLSDLLREWGLVHTADIIDRARLIYE
ncbi:MAG: hypothetical protein JWO03_1750, partial [Bacteroidetes bacterium]|nr:hypothetical protein [Bacteroidota bacterium]